MKTNTIKNFDPIFCLPAGVDLKKYEAAHSKALSIRPGSSFRDKMSRKRIRASLLGLGRRWETLAAKCPFSSMSPSLIF